MLMIDGYVRVWKREKMVCLNSVIIIFSKRTEIKTEYILNSRSSSICCQFRLLGLFSDSLSNAEFNVVGRI
jgi:hypothetical protein